MTRTLCSNMHNGKTFSSVSSFVFFGTLLQLFTQTHEDDNCTTFICRDTSKAFAQCCVFYENQYHGCCYYVPVYNLWYFWFGILCGLALLGFGIYAGSKYYLNRTSRNRNHRNINPDISISFSRPGKSNAVTHQQEELPTYEQLHVQGISEQYQQYSKHNNTSYQNNAFDLDYPHPPKAAVERHLDLPAGPPPTYDHLTNQPNNVQTLSTTEYF